jgi:hypothetical protein
MTQPRRKGKPGRLEVWQDKKTIAYAYFRPKLEALKSFEQAQALWQESPSQINPRALSSAFHSAGWREP